MIVDVVMPRLSDTMTEGYIVIWHKSVGEQVSVGDDLVDIDADKATVTHESQHAGILIEAEPASDEPLPVGQVIARLQISD